MTEVVPGARTATPTSSPRIARGTRVVVMVLLLVHVVAESARGVPHHVGKIRSARPALSHHEQMPDPSRAHDVTELLVSWGQGDTAALDRLVPLVYDDLRRVARRHLRRERPGHTLQASALVHEVFLRLADVDRMTLKNRTHFFALSARLMRQILVDHARRQGAGKRGGGATLISLNEAAGAAAPTSSSSVNVLALDEALEALSSFDVRPVPRRGTAILCRAQHL
jgi:RNA polymerase sigma factor (TIGR02999 family)